jgi:glycerol uptake facilitator protein
MPRIAHAILPIKGKGSSDWSYAWVPIVGPMIGGVLGAWAFLALGGTGILPGVV